MKKIKKELGCKGGKGGCSQPNLDKNPLITKLNTNFTNKIKNK